MKRILFIISEEWYFMSHRLNLAIEALEKGYKVGILCNKGKNTLLIKEKGIEVFNFSLSRTSLSPLNHVRTIIKISETLKLFKPDLIHAVAIKPVIFSSLVTKFHNLERRVFALGGLGFIFSSNKFLAKLLRPFVVLFLKYCLSGGKTRLIMQNKDDCKKIWDLKLIEENKTRLIEGAGVNTDLFVPEEKQFKKIPTVILPARLLWDKGIGEFVEAARIIKSKSIKARFILVGSQDIHNPENIQLQVIDKWVDQGLIEYWGFSDNMPKIMREASIICLPSYREGLPKVLIEAASCAKPIVTTNVPGCKEVVSHGLNGYLVNERESKDLAIFLEELILDKSLRYSMGQEGRKIVLERFAEDLINKKTRKVWEELLL
tara:strand:- start:529 stop:1653 length:1125 start_codon:yes stop_codon:yes gene_type:complete